MYNERTKTLYTRAAQAIINLPMEQFGLPADIRFVEQDVIIEGDGQHVPLDPSFRDYCGVTLSDENDDESFPVLDEIGRSVRTCTLGELRQIIDSLYAHCAAYRDANPIDYTPVERPDVPEAEPAAMVTVER